MLLHGRGVTGEPTTAEVATRAGPTDDGGASGGGHPADGRRACGGGSGGILRAGADERDGKLLGGGGELAVMCTRDGELDRRALLPQDVVDDARDRAPLRARAVDRHQRVPDRHHALRHRLPRGPVRVHVCDDVSPRRRVRVERHSDPRPRARRQWHLRLGLAR